MTSSRPGNPATAPAVVHFSTADREGGSARSARRIHQGLLAAGWTSRMLVGQRAAADDPTVDTVHGGGWLRLADRLTEAATRRAGLQYLWYPSGGRVRRHPWVRQAGVIQLYNSHGGWLSHRLLPALARQAPVVWRLSDQWPMTGHCAYAGACERWQTGCGACPDLATYPALPVDTTAWLWRIKRAVCRQVRPTVVAPSRWIEASARRSPIFDGAAIHRIANGLDLSVFRPLPKPAARAVLGLPAEADLILFSAHILDHNPRKGSAAAIAALNRLGPRPGLTVVLAGIGGASWAGAVPQPVIRLGYLQDDRLIAAANAAADLVLAPAAVENLPNGILEAMACGTPVVATDAGGIADAVRHQDTGWLAPAGEIDRLAQGLAWLLDDPDRRRDIAGRGLALIRAEFDAAVENARFQALYRSLAAPSQAGTPA